jgi:hypothetical protein
VVGNEHTQHRKQTAAAALPAAGLHHEPDFGFIAEPTFLHQITDTDNADETLLSRALQDSPHCIAT